ncbi:uncharacterized protein [Henckelia pumila]|uniref:uncharacterized protein n=1 Tax=Henckelia pumila TaxID=405737 RepID=UPI003C6E33A9
MVLRPMVAGAGRPPEFFKAARGQELGEGAKTSELLILRQGSMFIDEYQQKFFELLPYCSQISDSTEVKYNLFLQGFNPKIHGHVSVGDDMTYEGLVSQCRQAKDSIRRNRSFLFSRPASSFGPRTQSFKKSASSSSFGSGGVMCSGKNSQCNHCGKNHPSDKCRKALGACFRCGEIGHLKKDCPQAGRASGSGSGFQTTAQQRPSGQSAGGSNLRPCAASQVFALNHEMAVEENERVIAGMFLLCVIPTFLFIDTGASHSFISAHFVKRHKVTLYFFRHSVFCFDPDWSVSVAKRLVLGCPLEFEGNILTANLMILAIEDFDYIFGN